MWHTPEELVEIGFRRSRVVMMNEAHDGMMRCPRTREIGQRILPTAHRLGVRYLAIEALYPPSVAEESNRQRQLPEKTSNGYLNQPEMRALIQTALDLGWTLIAYEADMNQMPKGYPLSQQVTNWREEAQACNLLASLQSIPPHAQMVVWCGNGHLTKDIHHATMIMHEGKIIPKPAEEPDWIPMGYRFKQLSGLDPFAIDQTVTVRFPSMPTSQRHWYHAWLSQLEEKGGTAGFLKEEMPKSLSHLAQRSVDAFLLSTHNDME